MKLVAQLHLKPTDQQRLLLKATLERANAACNAISEYALHDALYHRLRAEFSLTAQLVIRCLSKVADAYKLDKNAKRHFKEHGSIAYDQRILTYHTAQQSVSIWTLSGRAALAYVCGERQQELLKHQ